jgi:hypothetical protein
MRRPESLDLPHIDVATTLPEFEELHQSLLAYEIPAFGSYWELHTDEQRLPMELDSAVSNAGYNVSFPGWFPLPVNPTTVRSRINAALGRLVDTFHFDELGDEDTLRFHKSRDPYWALFATPVSKDGAGIDMKAEQEKLWSGIVDPNVWKHAQQHRTHPEVVVLMRSHGSYRTAHDFQSLGIAPREIEFGELLPRVPTPTSE